ANPDVKVGIDPRARVQLSELVSMGAATQMVLHRDALERWVAAERAEQGAQKRLAVAGISLPRVFAVEDDGNQRRIWRGHGRTVRRRARPLEEVGHGGFGLAVGVG